MNSITGQQIAFALVTDSLAFIPGASVIVGVSEALIASSCLIYHIAMVFLNPTIQEYRRTSLEHLSRSREADAIAAGLAQDPSFTKSTSEMERLNTEGNLKKYQQLEKEEQKKRKEFETKVHYCIARIISGIIKAIMPYGNIFVTLLDLATWRFIYFLNKTQARVNAKV